MSIEEDIINFEAFLLSAPEVPPNPNPDKKQKQVYEIKVDWDNGTMQFIEVSKPHENKENLLNDKKQKHQKTITQSQNT